MIPKLPTYLQDAGQPQILPSYTYKFDRSTKHIAGKIDSEEAIKQAIYLYLNTELAEWDIFPDNDYGIEAKNLYGKDPEYVRALIESRVKDALSIDTRIDDILDFTTEVYKTENGTAVVIRFYVQWSGGEFEVEENLDFSAQV